MQCSRRPGKTPTVVALTLALGLLAAPLAAEAQQPAGKVYRIGLLGTSPINPHYEAFRQGLRELGYVEGRNIVIERRHSEGKAERLPNLATELIRLKVDVIVIEACGAPLNAASQKTSTIPIVVAACNDDLVASGLVASLARPGGNITGLSEVAPELAAKRLELLKEVVPKLTRVAVLWNPAYSEVFSPTLRFMLSDWKEIREAARVLGVTLQSVEIRGPDDFDSAFAAMTRKRAGGLITFSEPLLVLHGRRIADLAAQSRLPAIYAYRELAEAGGLISYGVHLPDFYRRAATHVHKILKGAKPADLPVEQPTKFELVINLKTAKTLGLTIPQSVLIRADKVIE
ncbi:MAG: ABC transporter substrate-binding protein [Candidatus Rokubacteria bacterium]|nr:ABC transporter substrate-binding protein [Candidatus Rokubacteria bacterium]MBI2553353.1 ABC transporter substrate-binding protein [Candidatus Rokubacteria bacterium]